MRSNDSRAVGQHLAVGSFIAIEIFFDLLMMADLSQQTLLQSAAGDAHRIHLPHHFHRVRQILAVEVDLGPRHDNNFGGRRGRFCSRRRLNSQAIFNG